MQRKQREQLPWAVRKERQKAAEAAARARREKERWYIRFNYGVKDHNGKWMYAVWPMLFLSSAHAYAHMEWVERMFLNSAANEQRPKLKSASVEKARLT